MRRARALSAALVLLAGVTLHTVQAAPLRTAQVRAQSCCAGKCQRMASLGQAMQCCRVPQEAGTTVTLSVAPPAPQPLALLATAAPTLPAGRAPATRPDGAARWSRAGPVYLQTHALLL